MSGGPVGSHIEKEVIVVLRIVHARVKDPTRERPRPGAHGPENRPGRQVMPRPFRPGLVGKPHLTKRGHPFNAIGVNERQGVVLVSPARAAEGNQFQISGELPMQDYPGVVILGAACEIKVGIDVAVEAQAHANGQVRPAILPIQFQLRPLQTAPWRARRWSNCRIPGFAMSSSRSRLAREIRRTAPPAPP